MSRRLDRPNASGGNTDHSEEIAELRRRASSSNDRDFVINLNLAADLLEAHDESGISLDDWPWARQFVERAIAAPVIPNCI